MIAQGSVFAVFGTDLANPGLAQVSAFPLPLSLGGTSAQVAVGGTILDCYMIFTTPGQLAVLLPSATPVGSGTLTLTVNGQQMSEPIDVVANSPGIFSQNSQGSGPASFQNFISQTDTPLNQVDQAINNGDVGILWLTGVGPASGDEAAGPLPGNMSGLDVQVYVGGVLVTDILYIGRSGCCSGIDQIVFRIPPGVEGCWSPVVVVINGVPSNATSISVAPSGTVCSQPGTFSSTQLSSLLNWRRDFAGGAAAS